MKKMVKVYDIKSYMEKLLKEQKLTTFGYSDSLAIITNEMGKGMVIDRDGCFALLKDSTSDTVEISLCSKPKVDKDNPNIKTIPIVPSHNCILTIQEIIGNCNASEEPLGKFVRVFGERLERNYCNILNHIEKELGLNKADYNHERKSR